MAASGQAVEDEAFVTLATNDTYALGALVLGNSLRRAATTRKLAILITHGVTQSIRAQLSEVYDVIQEVDVLDSRDQVNLALLTRPDLGITFTKLHCWRLTQFTKCVFMDADTLVLQNIDELFEREEISAAPDAGWPDCFNSGVFVFRPSLQTYENLLAFALTQGSFDGGDQGLLNMYFSDWSTKDISKHLPFVYNVVSQAFYSYLPAFRYFGKEVKVVHFIGSTKPWHHAYNTNTGQVEPQGDAGHDQQFLQIWWNTFMQNVQPSLDPTLLHAQLQSTGNSGVTQVGLVGEMASLKVHDVPAYPETMLSDRARQYSWERGQIDYKGIDAFDNIQKRLDDVMNGKKATQEVEPESAKKTAKGPAPK